jgi:hypothetical protein
MTSWIYGARGDIRGIHREFSWGILMENGNFEDRRLRREMLRRTV